jgi:hypothetical protein
MGNGVSINQLESHLWEAATILRGIEKANPETLYGIFGDAAWTNKERLPDALAAWLASSRQVRESLKAVLEVKP